MAFGRVIDRLVAAGIDGPAGIVRRVAAVADRYGSRPLETFAPPDAPGLPRLARWLNTCTAEHTRVAVLGFEPQIMVLAERGFAGGMAFFDVAWFGSDADQRVTLERWSRQDVPAVLAMESEWGSFSRDYALVRAHVDREYQGRATLVVRRNERSEGLHQEVRLTCGGGTTPRACPVSDDTTIQ